jgi:hypothetical protein
MNNSQLGISTIIMVGIAAVVGIILFTAGYRKSKLMLRTLGIGFLIAAGVVLFVMSAELREILTAFAAVVAAIVAAFSINESRRIRQDSIDRESRDRKDRLVSEVTEWLRELDSRIHTGLGKIGSAAREAITADSVTQVERLFHAYGLDIAIANADALVSSILEAQYYQRLASNLDERLGSAIEIVVNSLEARLQLVREDMGSSRDYGKEKEGSLIDELIENADRPLEGLNLSEGAIRTVLFGRNARAIRKAILDAVNRAIELKTSLMQVS